MTVRTRFAPSPTGYLHIGGLRTALYCYLLAKKMGGTFILRIEDTDQERLVSGSLENLIENLRWAGLNFDEGPEVGGPFAPYIQSERLDIYKKYAFELVENGHAYYCFCKKETLDEMREQQKKFSLPPKYDGRCSSLSSKEVAEKLEAKIPFVLRQKMPTSRRVEFIDNIRGRVKFESKDLEDQVLLKSDGFPTYHLASVVDDHLMEITHVFRGEEWLPSTPKHILLYEAFGWNQPEFAHLPLILNKDRSKLSKRQNDVSTESYRQKGYIKEAIINFIALLGWNTNDNKEIYTMDELIESFSIDRVQKSGAIFDLDKLDWYNWQWRRLAYLNELKVVAKKLDPAVEIHEFKPNHFNFVFSSEHLDQNFTLERGRKLLELVKGDLSENLLEKQDEDFLLRALITVEEKILQEPAQVMNYISFYFVDKLDYKKEVLLNEKLEVDASVAILVLRRSAGELTGEDFKTPNSLKARWIELIEIMEVKTGQMLWPCRVALSGEQFSPGVFEMAWAMGAERAQGRLRAAADYLEKIGS